MCPVTTLTLGSRPRQKGHKGVKARGNPGIKARGNPGVKAKKPQRCGPRRSPRQGEAQESHHILLGMLETVREYEGVNPHTPKATPTLGNGLPMDSQNFREGFQGSKLNFL